MIWPPIAVALAQQGAFEEPGWGGGPEGTLAADALVFHDATPSVRLARDATAEGAFSAVSRQRAVDFRGRTVRLEGWLRTEDLDGWAGLWLRIDGDEGALAFDNMQDRGLTGTTDWTQVSVEVPLPRGARSVVYGALLSGRGTAWADELTLTVDGRPPDRARPAKHPPAPVRPPSGVEIDALTARQVEDLTLLVQVWGFARAHHDAPVDWDGAFLRLLADVLATSDSEAARATLAAWLGELGPARGPGRPLRDPQLAPDLAWLDDRARLGDPLADALEQVYAHRRSGRSDQLSLERGVGNPVFDESSYPKRADDAGYRLLGLARLWNVIAWWFPYRDLLDDDWTDVLRESVPAVATAPDEAAYARALLGVFAHVHDTHANLWNALHAQPPEGSCRVPASVRFLGEQAVVWWEDGDALEVGDAILAIDGVEVPTLVDSWRPLYPASNEPTRLRDIGANLTRGPCGPVDLTVDRDGERLDVRTDRVEAAERPWTHDRPGEAFQLLTDGVGYLKLSAVVAAEVPSWLERAPRGLVVDIRNYPSEFVPFALGGHLVDRRTPFATFTRADLGNPGAFLWDGTASLRPLRPRYAGRVVVLVDEVTQSQAEYTAMALRAAGALVIGSTTAGADGNVSEVPLPGGLRGAISGIGVFYPDRTPTQRVGIVPDVEVRPTREGIRDGRDELVEEALRRIAPDLAEVDVIEAARVR